MAKAKTTTTSPCPMDAVDIASLTDNGEKGCEVGGGEYARLSNP